MLLSPSPSVPDLKIRLKAYRRFPLHPHVINSRARRTDLQRIDQFADQALIALRPHLHASVREVPHSARDTLLRRRSIHEGTIADTLNSPTDKDVDPDPRLLSHQ